MEKTTHTFKAEIQQVLDLVIHSLYSKKEIFLRELVSNASDAIDRAKYEGLTDKSLVADTPEWKISVTLDKEGKSLTIVDNGIGMTAEELESSLGTIARSGTKVFTEALKKKEKVDIPELIGQFGVGFYSAFMVAEAVTVETLRRGAGQQGAKWSSLGDGKYTVEPCDRKEPGTSITLRMREGMDEYLGDWRIKELIKRYSDFIAYPIYVTEIGKKEKDEKPAEPANTMRALWRRPKSEIKDDEYATFYKHLAHDHRDPLKTIHISAEGALEFKALLFFPKEGGMDLMMPNRKHGLQLYVRNVYIGSDFEELIPEYLRFVKGVVDSSDLPLNVSREMLQDDSVIRKIRTNLTGKVLNTLAEMMKDNPDQYREFYAAFGRILKEGLHTDWENQAKIKDLLLYHSVKTEGLKQISLKEYKAAMPEGQKEIYYLVSESLETARNSPHVEGAVKKGCDVLLMVDPVDQWIADGLREYDGSSFVAVDKADLEFGTEDEKKEARKNQEKAGKDLKAFSDWLVKRFEADVKEVRVSSRLTDSAVCLVADKDGTNAQMERLMRAMGQEVPKQKRILEINPAHPLTAKMKAMFEADAEDPKLAGYAEMLYGQALLAEGSPLPNPAHFVKLVAELMAR